MTCVRGQVGERDTADLLQLGVRVQTRAARFGPDWDRVTDRITESYSRSRRGEQAGWRALVLVTVTAYGRLPPLLATSHRILINMLQKPGWGVQNPCRGDPPLHNSTSMVASSQVSSTSQLIRSITLSIPVLNRHCLITDRKTNNDLIESAEEVRPWGGGTDCNPRLAADLEQDAGEIR
ncbi:hypothetical protein J6590_003443 [Homalodisca vitripennis]|nr:hypothetical protein J6590_003443 [Homalodisca vitripennis]